MSKVTEIRDPKTLQEVASHLEKTVIRQHKEIAKLRLDITRLRGQDVSPQMELELLKEQLEAMKRSMFLRTWVSRAEVSPSRHAANLSQVSGRRRNRMKPSRASHQLRSIT